MTAELRICVGSFHQPDCSHREYMRQGVEEFLASQDVRDALKAFWVAPVEGETTDAVIEHMVAYLSNALYIREGRRA